MVDSLTRARRSALMAQVRSKNTRPEKLAAKIVRGLGHRFRIHSKALPGKPDLSFPTIQKAIFVHGCFWHGHRRCGYGGLPKSRLSYWRPKIEANRKRDRRVRAALNRLGWEVVTVWQCDLKNVETVTRKLRKFLSRRR